MSKRLFLKSDPNQTLSSPDRESHYFRIKMKSKIHVHPKIGVPRLRDKTNKDVLLDASPSDNTRQIYDLVGQRIKSVTVLFVKTYGRFSNSIDSKDFSGKQLDSLIERMSEEFGGKKSALLWFNSPNLELGGKKPMYYVLQGKFDIIENLIDAIESGQPG
jgi:hypothetical protein